MRYYYPIHLLSSRCRATSRTALQLARGRDGVGVVSTVNQAVSYLCSCKLHRTNGELMSILQRSRAVSHVRPNCILRMYNTPVESGQHVTLPCNALQFNHMQVQPKASQLAVLSAAQGGVQGPWNELCSPVLCSSVPQIPCPFFQCTGPRTLPWSTGSRPRTGYCVSRPTSKHESRGKHNVVPHLRPPKATC